MGLFQKKVIKEVYGKAYGQLVWVHKIDVDTLCRDIRCVELRGKANGGEPVTLLRIFSLKETERKGVVVTGWQTLDRHPDLILFEGHMTRADEAYLVRKAA